MLNYPRLSPVNAALESLTPSQWSEVRGMRVADSFKSAEEEAGLLETGALCDVSFFPRLGIKGPAAMEWLSGQGLSIPQSIYQWNLLEPDGILVRTGQDEVFLEDGLEGGQVGRLTALMKDPPESVFRIERQDAGFFLSGPTSLLVMSQTCGYDFSSSRGQWIMTRVAGVSCMVLCGGDPSLPTFRVWCAASYGLYLWENFLKILRELGGDAVGWKSLQIQE